MNPDTNKFEAVFTPNEVKTDAAGLQDALKTLLRADGSPVPHHWAVFALGELVTIKNYTFRVAYIGESNILFEPVRPEDALKEQAR